MLSPSTRGVYGKVVGLLLVLVCLAFWVLSFTQSTPAAHSSPAAQTQAPAAYLPMILRATRGATLAATR